MKRTRKLKKSYHWRGHCGCGEVEWGLGLTVHLHVLALDFFCSLHARWEAKQLGMSTHRSLHTFERSPNWQAAECKHQLVQVTSSPRRWGLRRPKTHATLSLVLITLPCVSLLWTTAGNPAKTDYLLDKIRARQQGEQSPEMGQDCNLDQESQ